MVQSHQTGSLVPWGIGGLWRAPTLPGPALWLLALGRARALLWTLLFSTVRLRSNPNPQPREECGEIMHARTPRRQLLFTNEHFTGKDPLPPPKCDFLVHARGLSSRPPPRPASAQLQMNHSRAQRADRQPLNPRQRTKCLILGSYPSVVRVWFQ